MKLSRSGQGTVIIIAALFIVVMAVMQVAQSYLLTQIGDQTTRASLGRMCGLVAESAIDEARLVMAGRVDDRANALFDLVRTQGPQALAGSKIAGADLKLDDLPRLKRLLATETGKHVELLEPVTVEIQARGALTLVNPAEIDATLIYKVRTRSLLDKTIVREVEETQGLKMGQIAPAAPLPRSALIVRDPYKMVMGKRAADAGPIEGFDINDLRAKIVDQHYPKLKAKYADTMREFSKSEVNDVGFIRRVKPLYEKIANDGGKDHIAVVGTLGAAIRKYDPTPGENAPYMFVATAPTLGLETINLQYRLGTRWPALQKVLADIDQLGPQVQRMYDANDQSETAYQANVKYTGLMIDELNLLEDLLIQIGATQSVFHELKQKDDAATWAYMRQMLATIDPNALVLPFNAVSARAFYRIAEEPNMTIQAQWERLVKRLDAYGGGFCGVVYVENPNQILTLANELAGNLVIAVTGKTIVDGLRPKYASDTLTVVTRGGDPGAVRLSGAIQACISTRGVALSITPGTTIIGTLILDEIPLTLTTGLTGVVQADPRLADTNKPPFYYVALSPWLRSRSTLRF